MGSAAVNGPLWGARVSDWAEGPEAVSRPLFDAVYERVGLAAGEACLDLACGAGLASAGAVERGAAATGVDAAQAMVAYARDRTPAARFEVADLEALPFPDAAFDLVTSFNGVQYAADLPAAMREAARVLRPGGRAVIAVWNRPERTPMASVIGALRPLLPPPPPAPAPLAPGPFALSDPKALEGLATLAGWRPEAVFEVDFANRYPGLDAAVRGLDSSGVAARARAHAGEAAVSDAHADALARFLRSDGSVEVGVSYLVLLARA